MKIRQVILVCHFLCLNPAFAQQDKGVSSRAFGAGTYSLHFTDVFALHRNQAGLARLQEFSFGVFAERRFMLESLYHYNFAAAVPTVSGTFGLSSSWFGSPAFNQQQVGLAYGRSAGKKLDIGIQIDYLSTGIREYGHARAFTAEGGLIVHITDQWHAGVHVFNPAGIKYARLQEEPVPVIYSIGAGWEASEKFFIGAEASRESGQRGTLQLLMQYRPLSRFMMQTGIATDPRYHFLGIGFFLKDLRIDFTGSYHPQLGITPGAGIIFQLNKSS